MNGRPRILLATTNEGKIREIKPLFSRLGVNLIDLAASGFAAEFEETADTFEENSRSKALHYHELSKLPTIADDSGLVIDALDGEPGVHSSRYLGADVPHEAKMADVLKRLSGKKGEDRSAHFACAVSLALDGMVYCTISKRIFGTIAQKPLGKGGFGYDPIFYSPELRCTFGEAEQKDKDRVSHRGRAVRTLTYLLETHQELRRLLGMG